MLSAMHYHAMHYFGMHYHGKVGLAALASRPADLLFALLALALIVAAAAAVSLYPRRSGR